MDYTYSPNWPRHSILFFWILSAKNKGFLNNRGRESLQQELAEKVKKKKKIRGKAKMTEREDMEFLLPYN